jgi:S-adenosylmethionine:tRNA ribosyltransferase-isomerase
MKLEQFDYDLPDELIARYPAEQRTQSRLLCFNKTTGEIAHKHFYDLIDQLNPNDLLVFNNSKVIRARLFGQKPTGGKIEILVERVQGEFDVLAHVRSNKMPKPGGLIILDNGEEVEMLGRQESMFELRFKRPVFEVLDEAGHMPLPPYIDRADEKFDEQRYQTVYADPKGSVAAPTAGLHFDEELLEKIKAKGIAIGFLTLHVGAGTFQPVRAENITEHKMHSEVIDVSQVLCNQIAATKAKGGRVIAVGTTSLRSLETCAQSGEAKPYCGETDIFIYPGYEFRCIDALITNFHLPKSSLLMLISALAGREQVMRVYEEAIAEKYRFFSYGDSMFIF